MRRSTAHTSRRTAGRAGNGIVLTRRAIALGATAGVLAIGAWLGCSSSTPSGDTADGGQESAPIDTSAPDVPVDTTPPDTEAITCDNYCARVLKNCTGDAAQYADLGTCKKICQALTLGDGGDTSGNTVACRMYHAGAPALKAPGFHCAHAGPFGGDTCGTRCGAFCLLAGAQCPQAFTTPSCDAACGSAFAFSPSAGETPTSPTTGNTLNCREYHLIQAYGSPSPHCGHLGVTPPADASAGFPCK